MYKQTSYDLHKAIKEAKHQYRDKVESQFNGSDTRRMWQGLHIIMDCKGKASHVANTDASLPDKLKHLFSFKKNNTWSPAAHDAPISVAHVSKTFKYVNPRKPARTRRHSKSHPQSMCRPAGLLTYSISPYPSLLEAS